MIQSPLFFLMTGSNQIRVLLALIALVGTAQAEIRDFASPVTVQARDFQAPACPLNQSGCQEKYILEISGSQWSLSFLGAFAIDSERNGWQAICIKPAWHRLDP